MLSQMIGFPSLLWRSTIPLFHRIYLLEMKNCGCFLQSVCHGGQGPKEASSTFGGVCITEAFANLREAAEREAKPSFQKPPRTGGSGGQN